MSSWLSRQMGTNSLSQDFNYDPQMIDFQAPPMSSLGLAAQQNTASMMMGNASRMSGQANQMMDMNSGFYGQMQNNLQQQIGDATTSATSQANRQLSMTGGGGGSLRNLLGTANASSTRCYRNVWTRSTKCCSYDGTSIRSYARSWRITSSSSSN